MLSRRKRNFHATSSHSNTDLCLVEEHKITWKIFIEQYICDAIHSMVKDYCHGRKNPCLTCSNNGFYSGTSLWVIYRVDWAENELLTSFDPMAHIFRVVAVIVKNRPVRFLTPWIIFFINHKKSVAKYSSPIFTFSCLNSI